MLRVSSITGRKKEIIITSGGKNLSPEQLQLRKLSEFVKAVTLGDGQKYVAALIQIEPDDIGLGSKRSFLTLPTLTWWASRRCATYRNRDYPSQ